MVVKMDVALIANPQCPILDFMESDLRRKLGARLLTERIQVKNWNELKAARAAGIQPQTVRRIERAKNYEMDSLEKYAVALGRPLVEWLRDILLETQHAK